MHNNGLLNSFNRGQRTYKDVLTQKKVAYKKRKVASIDHHEKWVEKKRKHKTKVLLGEMNNENLEWLQRSIIGKVDHLIEVESLATKLFFKRVYISQLRDIGKYKFLITFSVNR